MSGVRTIFLDADFHHRFLVVVGSIGITFILFLVLPLIQSIKKAPTADLILQPVDTANVPPPPPPPEKEPEKTVKEEKPPELKETAPPLDLSQLELALNPSTGFSEDWMGGDFSVKLNTAVGGSGSGGDVDSLFSMADLDQQPRVIYQPGPTLNDQLRRKAPGTVYVLFIVDQGGRVENPLVQKSSDSIFETPALAAVKQWKFEPGKRNGKAVRFRMRVPISFPKG